jgi:hypothetical protein
MQRMIPAQFVTTAYYSWLEHGVTPDGNLHGSGAASTP